MKKLLFPVLIFMMALIPAMTFAWDVGDRVFVDWSGDDYWYPATIVEKDGYEYYVIFDDFDREWTDIDLILEDDIGVGDWVESNWLGDGAYYGGEIIERIGNMIYIVYDDGDEEATTIAHIRY